MSKTPTTRGRLLGATAAIGFCAAWSLLDGGATAAAVAACGAIDEDTRKRLQGAVSGTVQGLASWWINRRVSRDEAARARELADGRQLLENHHLLRLLELALAEALRSLRGQVHLKSHTELLESMAEAADGLFVAWAEAESGALAEWFHVPNLLESTPQAGGSADPLLADEALGDLLDELAARADEPLSPSLQRRLRERLRDLFPAMVQAVLKRDYGGNTPLEGQAFAALWLQVERRRSRDLAAVRESLGGLSQELEQLGRRLERSFLQRLQRIRARDVLRDKKLSTWLTSWRKSLTSSQQEVLSGLEALLARFDSLEDALRSQHCSSVTTLEVFERRTRMNIERQSFLGPLMDEPAILRVLTGRPVGRDPELLRVEEFLEHPSLRVQYWKAVPGSGKTRLAIEAARLAESRGWVVRVLEEPEHGRDPARALAESLDLGVDGDQGPGAKLLLIWDTSARAVDVKQARSIYELRRRGVFFDRGIEVKLLVLSWPVHARALEEDFRDASDADWFSTSTLEQVGHSSEFQELMEALLPESLGQFVPDLVQAAEGNALDCLSAVIELKRGVSLAELRTRQDIQGSRYRDYIGTVLGADRGTPHGEALLDVLRILSLRQSVSAADATRALGERSETWLGLAADLRSRHAIRCEDDQTYTMSPDRFRIEVTRLALTDDGSLGTAHDLEHWKQLVADWVEEDSFDQVFAVIQEALSGDPRFAELFEFLCARLAGAESLSPEQAESLALTWERVALMSADPALDRSTLVRLEALLKAHPAARVAEAVARTLFGLTTFSSVGFQERRTLAQRIEALMDRDPSFATPEIALQLAKALFNTTFEAKDAAARESLAQRIEALMDRDPSFATPEIALRLAKGLSSTTAVTEDAAARESLVQRIGALMDREASFATPEIALELAMALYNITVVAEDVAVCESVVQRIEALMDREASFATPEIALELAKALFNITVIAQDAAVRESLAQQIEALMDRDPSFATPEIALRLAKALFNTTFVTQGAAARESLALRIEALMDRDPSFATPEIALRLAKALSNTTAVAEDAAARDSLAQRIEALMERDASFRTPEIALELLRARAHVCLAAADRAACDSVVSRASELLTNEPDSREGVLKVLKMLRAKLPEEPWSQALIEFIDTALGDS